MPKLTELGIRWCAGCVIVLGIATIISYFGVLFGLPPEMAKAFLATLILVVLVLWMLVTISRKYYKATPVVGILIAVWVIGQVIYWSPFLAAM